MRRGMRFFAAAIWVLTLPVFLWQVGAGQAAAPATQQEGQQVMVLPGGEPFGMKLFAAGVMVTGFSEITTPKGNLCPAKEAGLKLGDVIISLNEAELRSNDQLIRLVEASAGKEVTLEIKRKETAMTLKAKAVANQKGEWRLGVWVKDSSAGIGTVTFYHPDLGAFGGLGHPICEPETGQKVPLREGQLVKAVIDDFKKAEPKQAGELKGYFASPLSGGQLWGNTDCGIFGSYKGSLPKKEGVAVATPEQVQVGDAVMFTTISGSTPKGYAIRIEKINKSEQETKNLVLRVTDPDLLATTGGILQGMSGSPIIQNGKLVGAVTHVFLGDSAKGYGVFAHTMLKELEKLAE